MYVLRTPLFWSGACLGLCVTTASCASDSGETPAEMSPGGTAGATASAPTASSRAGAGGSTPVRSSHVAAGASAAESAADAPKGESPTPANDPAPTSAPAPSGISPEDSIDDAGRIVARCHGLPLVGMKYSPGGTTLPNKCAPFDVRSNNPYAVRCIDAMPDFKTPFPGDEYCILPPPPELGFQLGVHPGGNVGYWEKMWARDYSFYQDASVTDPYVVLPGDEKLENYLIDFEGPTDERYYYRRYFRGRFGSHHGTATFTGAPVVEGWQGNGDRSIGTSFVTVQNAYTDIPQNAMDISPEEKGIGIQLPLNSGVNMNLHHFNSTDAPLLRENWVNAWYMPKEEVTRRAQGILIAAAVNFPIGMKLDSEGSAAASSETQVLSLWGHRHAWTTRFHAWVVRKDGSEELVYDSHDWNDMPTFSYNSVAKNPEPGKGSDGASTGPLVLHPGDEMHFNCHVETTKERADEIGVPLPSQPITWANEATTAEMCLLEGQTTGGALFGGIEHITID